MAIDISNNKTETKKAKNGSIDIQHEREWGYNTANNSSIDNSNSKFALTTIDNPYDPFTQFTDWYMFDVSHGYNSCCYLARIALISEDLSPEENNIEKERAIDEIVKLDFTHKYKKAINKNYKLD